jgi:hypothetical protein
MQFVDKNRRDVSPAVHSLPFNWNQLKPSGYQPTLSPLRVSDADVYLCLLVYLFYELSVQTFWCRQQPTNMRLKKEVKVCAFVQFIQGR